MCSHAMPLPLDLSDIHCKFFPYWHYHDKPKVAMNKRAKQLLKMPMSAVKRYCITVL